MHPVAVLTQVPLLSAPSQPTRERHLRRFGVHVTNQSIWCWARCSSAVRELPRGQCAWHPEATCKERHRWGTSVGYYGEPVVLRDHGDSGNLYSFSTGCYPACYQCGVASAQCGGIGSLGAVFPQYQVTLLASYPFRSTTPTIGSLVTSSFCLGTFPLCLPVPVCVMCDVSSCVTVFGPLSPYDDSWEKKVFDA